MNTDDKPKTYAEHAAGEQGRESHCKCGRPWFKNNPHSGCKPGECYHDKTPEQILEENGPQEYLDFLKGHPNWSAAWACAGRDAWRACIEQERKPTPPGERDCEDCGDATTRDDCEKLCGPFTPPGEVLTREEVAEVEYLTAQAKVVKFLGRKKVQRLLAIIGRLVARVDEADHLHELKDDASRKLRERAEEAESDLALAMEQVDAAGKDQERAESELSALKQGMGFREGPTGVRLPLQVMAVMFGDPRPRALAMDAIAALDAAESERDELLERINNPRGGDLQACVAYLIETKNVDFLAESHKLELEEQLAELRGKLGEAEEERNEAEAALWIEHRYEGSCDDDGCWKDNGNDADSIVLDKYACTICARYHARRTKDAEDVVWRRDEGRCWVSGGAVMHSKHDPETVDEPKLLDPCDICRRVFDRRTKEADQS